MQDIIEQFRKIFTPPYSSKDIKTIAFTIALLLSLPILLIAVRNQTANRSHAAENKSYEAESGIPNGPVTEGSETTASGGKYIQFGSGSGPNPTATPTPNGTQPTNTPTPSGGRDIGR